MVDRGKITTIEFEPDVVVAVACVDRHDFGKRRVDPGDAGAEDQDAVVARTALDHVIAPFVGDEVIAHAAAQGVAARATIDDVVADAAINSVGAETAENLVRPVTAVDGRARRGAEDQIIAARAGNGWHRRLSASRIEPGEVGRSQAGGSNILQADDGERRDDVALGPVVIELDQSIRAVLHQTQHAIGEGIAPVEGGEHGRTTEQPAHHLAEVQNVARIARREIGQRQDAKVVPDSIAIIVGQHHRVAPGAEPEGGIGRDQIGEPENVITLAKIDCQRADRKAADGDKIVARAALDQIGAQRIAD